MRVAGLQLKTYKSFTRPATVPFLPTLNIFIGPNNCGKTNILDALVYIAGAEENRVRLYDAAADIEAVFQLTDLEAKTLAVPMHIRAVWKDGGRILYDATGAVLPGSRALEQFLARHIRSLHYKDFSDYERIQGDYHSLRTNHQAAFTEFSSHISRYFPEVSSLDRITDVEERNATGAPHAMSLDRIGGGFRRVLVMLLYAFHPEYPVVLIDEPEIHLHPGMIKRIVKVFESPATNQIIATSHSPLFIQAHTLNHVYRVLRDESGSHVYYLRPTAPPVDLVRGGVSNGVDLTRLEQELHSDNLEMFFADAVLLVEGVSDRILMRGLIDKFYHGIKDIKVIYAHGKTNMDIYVRLMQQFRIPFVVLLDRDAAPMIRDIVPTLFAREQGGKLGADHSPADSGSLTRRGIFILDNGTIEHNYPRRYQVKESKPLNALYAVSRLTEREFLSPEMKRLREVIEAL